MINIMNFFERIINKPHSRFSVGQKIHSIKIAKVELEKFKDKLKIYK